MSIERKRFFGTDNLHKAGWTVIIGLAGFVGAGSYQKVFGPQTVFVQSIVPSTTPVRVTTEIQPRARDISALATAIEKLASATSNSSEPQRLNELSAEVDHLRAEVAKSRGTSTLLGPPSSKHSGGDAATEAPLGKFALPPNVEGYTQASLLGVSKSSCPPSVMQPGDPIGAAFILTDESLLSRASPLNASIDRIRTPTDLLQITEAWHVLKNGLNSISFGLKLDPGTYQLTYGFFLREELSGKFPLFHSRQCKFIVR